MGLVKNVRPYMVNISAGGEFRRLDPEREAELKDVALEFGRLAKLAIGERFDAGHSSASATPGQSS